MRNWIALCAIMAALMMNITSSFHKKRFDTSVPIVVNGTGTLLLNLSLSRRCPRLTLSIRNNRHGKGVQIAIDFVETLLQPVSVAISEENIQSRNALSSNSKCSQPRTVSSKITFRNNAIDFRIGERWRLIHYTSRPNHHDLFSIEVNKSKARCCYVYGTVEWNQNDEKKPIIKIRTATVLNARQLESVKRSELSSNLEKGLVDSKISPELRTPTTLTRDRFDYGSNISAVEYGSNVRPKHSFTSSTADHDSLSLATYRNMDYSVYASTMPTKRRSGKRNSVNDEWTSTFLIFFGIEVFFISSFIIFGLVMFACLQRHPKQSREHHHSENV